MRHSQRARVAPSSPLRGALLATFLVGVCNGVLAVAPAGGVSSLHAGADRQQEAEPAPVPPQLADGGRIVLENDLHAASDALVRFREFRGEFRRLDAFEEVDEDEEPELRGVLSSDPEGILGRDLVSRGFPYPEGYWTTQVLVVYTVEERQLLWFDCEVWDTSRRTGGLDSHEKLVRALGTAVADAGGTQIRPS